MPPAATFHTQLASIMEVLANTAVAEICELVDSGYAVLQLEISRSRKENEVLRRKLRLMELRTARATALRAAATASGSALPYASGRARVQLSSRSRPTGQMALCRLSNPESPVCRDPSPPTDLGQENKQERPVGVETTAVVKVEDVEESWSPLERDKGSPVAEEQTTEMDDASPLVKHEAGDRGGSASCQSWTSGEVSSTSMSNQKTLHSGQTLETSSYDCALFEPPLQHGSQNPLGLDLGCSGMSASGSGSSFSYTLSEANLEPVVFHSSQQRALPPSEEQQLPVRQEVAETSTVRREGRQDGVSRGESGGKSFVCNYCGKALACFKNLKTHMRVHTGEKPFVCALCGKRFSDSSNLKRHQSVHTGEKRYGCVHCGKRFAQSGSLKVHMSVHTDYKQFMCSFCGKTFISSSHLRRHIALHTEEKQLANALQ